MFNGFYLLKTDFCSCSNFLKFFEAKFIFLKFYPSLDKKRKKRNLKKPEDKFV